MEGKKEKEWTTERGVLLGSSGSNRVWGGIEVMGGILGITVGNVKVMARN